jgi:cysteine-rich repeat protein
MRLAGGTAAVLLALTLGARSASADAAACIETISKATAKYEIAVQKASGKCEDAKAKGKATSCPDSKTSSKIAGALTKFQDAINKDCASEALADIGFAGLVNRCVGGTRDMLFCVGASQCPGACLGGGEPGKACTADGNCPALCVGGSNNGGSCAGGGATACTTGGGTCSSPGTCAGPAPGVCSAADRCPPAIDDNPPFDNCDAPLTDAASVATCLQCNADSLAKVATDFAWHHFRPPFGDPGFGVPDNGDDGKGPLGCQRAIGKSLGKYFQKVYKATQKCTGGVLKAGSGTCPDPKLTDAISKAQAKLIDKISKKCGETPTLFAESLNAQSILADDPLAGQLVIASDQAGFNATALALFNNLVGCSDSAAAPSLLNGCASLCGNGQVDVGEACDDGNVVNGDTCSSDCTVQTACAVTGTVTVTVNTAAPAAVLPLGALTTYLAYDESKVSLPGTGAFATSRVTAGAFSVGANDLDYAVRVTLVDPSDLGTPPFTIDFDICSAATVTAADFECMVEGAGSAAGGATAYGVSCSVSVP